MVGFSRISNAKAIPVDSIQQVLVKIKNGTHKKNDDYLF